MLAYCCTTNILSLCFKMRDIHIFYYPILFPCSLLPFFKRVLRGETVAQRHIGHTDKLTVGSTDKVIFRDRFAPKIVSHKYLLMKLVLFMTWWRVVFVCVCELCMYYPLRGRVRGETGSLVRPSRGWQCRTWRVRGGTAYIFLVWHSRGWQGRVQTLEGGLAGYL